MSSNRLDGAEEESLVTNLVSRLALWLEDVWRRLPPRQSRRFLRAEKRRLESFLDAAPSAFCGWSPDGLQAVSAEFVTLFGAEKVDTLDDLDPLLTPGDAIALRDNVARLRDHGAAFDLAVRLEREGRVILVQGRRGGDLESEAWFDTLWASDITKRTRAAERETSARIEAEREVEHLKSVLDNLPYPVWLRNRDAKITWVNKAGCQLLDSDLDEVVAHQRELSITRKNQLARKAMETGVPQSAKGHVVSQGMRCLLEASETHLPRDEMSVGTALDLTRMEEAETELQRHIEAHAEVLEQMGSAIAIYGPDQRLKFFNTAYAWMMDLDEAWLNGAPTLGEVLEVLRENRRLPEMADFRSYKKRMLDMFTSLIEPREDLIHLPDGAALREMITPHPFGGLLFNIEDVSARLALESSYNTLMAVQRETLDHLAEGLSVIGSDGRLKLWNPAFARIWDLDDETLADEPHISELIERMKPFFDPGEDWEATKKEMIVTSLDRQQRAGRLERADGSVLEYSAVPLPDGAILNSYLDISDSVRVEQALREKNAALEATDQLKTEFLANVSYKLRTPLNAIMGFGEILGENYFGELGARQREYVEGIIEAAGGLADLIDDILDLATVEAGYMELARGPVDLTEILAALEALTREWAGTQDIRLEFDLAPDLGTIEADARRLKQVVLNLISNAIRFTPPGGRITVEARREDGAVEIAVADTGVGIPLPDQHRVFGSFERAHNEAGQGGAGLGLALVKSFVELHGGYVALASSPGEGTRIACHLPADGRMAALWARKAEAAGQRPGGARPITDPGPERIAHG